MSLQIQQLRIAVGVTVKGEPKLLYLGRDSQKCDDAVAAVGPEFEVAASLPRGISPLVTRRPARESANAKAAAELSARREEAAKNAKRKEAEDKAVQARKLAAESAATLKEISKSDK